MNIHISFKYIHRRELTDLYHNFRRRQWQPTPVLLPGKSHGRGSLVSCSPWGRKESDMTEQLHFHFSLSCTGEGNGNPLQCSCLENLRDGGAWWAAIYGVTQNQTRLKRLSSSSSSPYRVTTDFTVYNSFAFSKRSNSWNHIVCQFSSVQFISVAQSCPTLCDPMNCST